MDYGDGMNRGEVFFGAGQEGFSCQLHRATSTRLSASSAPLAWERLPVRILRREADGFPFKEHLGDNSVNSSYSPPCCNQYPAGRNPEKEEFGVAHRSRG